MPFTSIVLPGGAELTYPGVWTEAPVGYEGFVIYGYRQALLKLKDGWTGTLSLPWVMWDIRGDGQVAIEGRTYSVGSSALQDRIRLTNRAIVSLDVLSSASVEVVFFVNATQFDVRATNRIELKGVHVWAANGDTIELDPANQAGASLPSTFRKPLPPEVP
jgi:hypothetical protein